MFLEREQYGQKNVIIKIGLKSKKKNSQQNYQLNLNNDGERKQAEYKQNSTQTDDHRSQ